MRTVRGSARTRARNRLLRRAKGYVGGRHRLYRTAKESLVRAGVYAFRPRSVAAAHHLASDPLLEELS